MKLSEIEKLTKKREKLLTDLSTCSRMIRGSIVETKRKCGRKDCQCANGKLHPHRYLSYSEKGRNKTVYVTDAEKRGFNNGRRSYEKAWSIICQISETNIKIIKEESRNARIKQG